MSSASQPSRKSLFPLVPRQDSTLTATPTLPSFASLPRRRARPATAACLACRKRKIKCTAQRPSCVACRNRGETCHYDANPAETPGKALKRRYQALTGQASAAEKLFTIMQLRSDEEANEIYQRIRRGEDSDALLRLVQHGDMLVQLAVAPATQLRYDFPYITSMPAYLCQPSNEYLECMLYEAALLGKPGQPVGGGGSSEADDENHHPYLRPLHAATVVDARLDAAKLSKWTVVSTDDGLMRTMMRSFFLYDYISYCSFHKDLFLDDLLSGGRRFCSSLLVNAILAHACHSSAGPSDRDESWNPRSLGYQFLAEARRLWDLEVGKNRLTTVQAGPLLYLTHAICGSDAVGRSYLIQSVSMAKSLGIFDSDGDQETGKMRHAKYFTAWSIFWCQSHATWYFNTAPFLEQPPKYPLPEPEGGSDWYGEILLKYQSSNSLYPMHFGSVIHAQIQLNVILNEMAQQCFDPDGQRPRYSLALISHYYKKMMEWHGKLPSQLKARVIVFPAHLNLHMHYFCSLARLVSVAVSLVPPVAHSLETAGWTVKQSPRELLQTVTVALETLLRVYYLRHGFEQFDTFLLQPLLEVTTLRQKHWATCKDDAETASIYSTLVLCAQGFRDQGRHHILGRTLFQLTRNSLPQQAVELVDKHLYATPLSRPSPEIMASQIHSNWPVNITGEGDDPQGHKLSAVLRRLEGLDLDSASERSASPTPDAD